MDEANLFKYCTLGLLLKPLLMRDDARQQQYAENVFGKRQLYRIQQKWGHMVISDCIILAI